MACLSETPSGMARHIPSGRSHGHQFLYWKTSSLLVVSDSSSADGRLKTAVSVLIEGSDVNEDKARFKNLMKEGLYPASRSFIAVGWVRLHFGSIKS